MLSLRRIIFVCVILNCFFIDSCKKRRSVSRIKSDGIIEGYFSTLKDLYEKIKVLEDYPHLLSISDKSNKTSYVKTLEEIYDRSIQSKFYDIKYYGLSAFSKIASQAEFGYIEFKGQRLHHTDIYILGLQSFYLPQQQSIEGVCPANNYNFYKFKVCSNFTQCTNVLDFMLVFASSYPSYSLEDNSKWANVFNNKINEISEDIWCLPEGGIFYQILNYKLRSIRAIARFYISSGINKRSNLGKTPQIVTNVLEKLKLEFDDLRRYAKTYFKNKEAISIKILDAIVNSNEDFKSQSIKELLIRDFPDSLGENRDIIIDKILTGNIYAYLKQDEKDLITRIHSYIYNSLYGIINQNLVIRIYLDRINQYDISKWLDCIKSRTSDWYKEYLIHNQDLDKINFDNISDRFNNSCAPFVIAPYLAFEVFIAFKDQEITLPFRQEWYRSLYNVVSQIPAELKQPIVDDNFNSRNITTDKYSFYLKLVNAQIEQYNKNLRLMLSNFELADKSKFDNSLIDKEKIIAVKVRNFHSWYYQLYRIYFEFLFTNRELEKQIYVLNYGQSFSDKQEQQEFEQLRDRIKYTDPALFNKQGFSKDEKIKAYEKYYALRYNLVSPLAQLSCLDYMFSSNPKTKYKLLNSTYKGWINNGCLANIRKYLPSWLNYITFSSGGISEALNNVQSDFEPTKDGSYNMEKMCRFVSSNNPTSMDMYALRRNINSWLTAQAIYDKCEEVSTQIKVEVGSTVALILAGQVAGLAMRAIVASRFASIVPQTIKAIVSAQRSLGVSSQIIMQTLAKEIIKRAPMWTFKLAFTAGVFTISNRMFLSFMGIHDFYGLDVKGISEFGKEFLVGMGIIGIIHVASPFIMRTSTKIIQYSLQDFKYLNQAWIKNLAALSLETGQETLLFVSIDPLSNSIYKALSSADQNKEIEMAEMFDHERNSWLSSLFLVLAFKLVNTGYSSFDQEFKFLDFKRQLHRGLRLTNQSRSVARPGIDVPMADYYYLLSTKNRPLNENSSVDAIRANVKELLRLFHPSNFESLPLEQRKAIYLKYIEILRAWNVLSNADMKMYYDKIYIALKKHGNYHQNTQGQNYYEVLGVSKGANQNDIKNAFNEKIKRYHPDTYQYYGIAKDVAATRYKALVEAFGVLSDPIQKAKYDSYLYQKSKNIDIPIDINRYDNFIRKQEQRFYPGYYIF